MNAARCVVMSTMSMVVSALDITRDMYTLVGQGGYEGLTAYVILEVPPGPPTFSGIIFPTAMPETPEPYAGE